MCAAYGPTMSAHHRPHDQTPDEQRFARDKRWAQATSMHWHVRGLQAATRSLTNGSDGRRGAKPTLIPSHSPEDDASAGSSQIASA